MATKLSEPKLNEATAAEMRAAMVDSQLRTNDVIDPAIVAAMGAVAREDHVPPAMAGVAYMDRAIPLGSGRALNAPLVTGRLLVAASLRPAMRVLLVGAATGYAAACLAELGVEVVALEESADLAAMAPADDRINWIAGPLGAGAPDQPPFDRIIIEGAIEALPAALVDQLVEGGRLVAAIRDGAVSRLVQGVKTGGTLALRPFADMDVAPLPGFARPAGFRF
ncbi:protein-L-isoaspartate O-methyltransferase [Sphingopyxis sp. KK2]|uniref:protein-L-isoaspartate O-methyltransferase family protein n=1 Tax=Sphingopyxis sp. KK2 TaxID=1855727 RepID=UPI00097E5D32|nr:protein-L-isoaspartate O-methyltransferase [Sphingopyxis sp. KK2]